MTVKRTAYVAMLIGLFLGLVGCRFGRSAAPPDLTLMVDDQAFVASQSSYCWDGLCADAVYPPVIESFTTLPADGAVTLTFDNPLPDTAFIRLDRYETFPEAESVATLSLASVENPISWPSDVPSGDYILSVSARWANGNDSAYHIGVTVP